MLEMGIQRGRAGSVPLFPHPFRQCQPSIPSGLPPLVLLIPFLRGSCSPLVVPCGDSGPPPRGELRVPHSAAPGDPQYRVTHGTG